MVFFTSEKKVPGNFGSLNFRMAFFILNFIQKAFLKHQW